MPYRPEAELKRPDLKGEFTCGVCFKHFCHAASLNRHRLNFHSGNHHCRLCNCEIPNGENLKSHMAMHHGIERVFTCGCCNWAFPDKKELHQHTSAMIKTGEPGTAQPIATNLSVVPGSMVAEKSPGLHARQVPSTSGLDESLTPSSSSGATASTSSTSITVTPKRTPSAKAKSSKSKNTTPGACHAPPTFPGVFSPLTSMPMHSPMVASSPLMASMANPLGLPTSPLFGGISATPSMFAAQPADMQRQLLQMLALQLQAACGPPPAWLRGFLANNQILPGVIKNMCSNNNGNMRPHDATETSHSEDEHQSASGAGATRAGVIQKGAAIVKTELIKVDVDDDEKPQMPVSESVVMPTFGIAKLLPEQKPIVVKHEEVSETHSGTPSPHHSDTVTPEWSAASPLSVAVSGPSSPACSTSCSSSGRSTSTDDAPISMVTTTISPGASRKRKRTIADVVSFLTKKQVTPV